MNGRRRQEGVRKIESGCEIPSRTRSAETGELHQGTGACSLSRHAPHSPLRGEGRPALRHGLHRRLLPPLYRPGSRRHRHEDGADRRRPDDHRLSRPRPHAGDGHVAARRHGRADRTPWRLLQGQGRLDAHVLQGEEFLRRPRHRRRAGFARHRPRLRQPLSRQQERLADLFRRRRRQPGPGLRELQHGLAVEAAGHLRHREQPLRDGHLRVALVGRDRFLAARRVLPHSRHAGRRHGRAGGEVGRRGRGRMVPGGQGSDHPRDADLSLSRPLHVRSRRNTARRTKCRRCAPSTIRSSR